MPVSEQYVRDVDLDNETDEALIAAKINSEIASSVGYWQSFKDMCTELYFDFLAWKESVDDKSRSNTFIPLSYVDIQVTKARLKRATITARPYGRIKPVPFNADLSFRLSQFIYQLLQEADFEDFWDILVQDALIYPGAPFQVTWGAETKLMPAFQEIEVPGMPPLRFPLLDENGRRVYTEQEVRDGLVLETIPIQDFYLPKNSKKVETDPWAGKMYNADLQTLQRSVNSDGSPKYRNLDRLGVFGDTKRPDSAEQARMAEPSQRDQPVQPTFGKTWDIVEFVTRDKVFHVPYGCDFLISDPEERNPYRQMPFHIARVEKLNNEPYGFCPNRANHKMSRTFNEMVDITMDGLFKEDNKAFIYNDELVNGIDVGGEQGNLIPVHGLDPGHDVATAVKALETRAYATEILPMMEWMTQVHQEVASRSASDAGIAQQGAETAFENALIEAGSAHRPLDMAQNLVTTAMKPIYLDALHLARGSYLIPREMDVVDDTGQDARLFTVHPYELQATLHVDFDFIDKERKKMEERAATVNLLQVWGQMANVDPVSVLLMKGLLLNSGIADTEAIQKALDESVKQRQMLQVLQLQMEMRAQAEQAKGAKTTQRRKKPSKESAVSRPGHKAGNSISTMKRPGV